MKRGTLLKMKSNFKDTVGTEYVKSTVLVWWYQHKEKLASMKLLKMIFNYVSSNANNLITSNLKMSQLVVFLFLMN